MKYLRQYLFVNSEMLQKIFWTNLPIDTNYGEWFGSRFCLLFVTNFKLFTKKIFFFFLLKERFSFSNLFPKIIVNSLGTGLTLFQDTDKNLVWENISIISLYTLYLVERDCEHYFKWLTTVPNNQECGGYCRFSRFKRV